jgi:hypothetical protein
MMTDEESLREMVRKERELLERELQQNDNNSTNKDVAKLNKQAAEAESESIQQGTDLIRQASPLIDQFFKRRSELDETERKAVRQKAEIEQKTATEKKLAEIQAHKTAEKTYEAEQESIREQERRKNMSAVEKYREMKQKKKEWLKDKILNNKLTRGMDVGKEVTRDITKLILKVITIIITVTIIIGIIFAIIFFGSLWLYSAQAINCAEFRTPGLQGREAFKTDMLSNIEFRNCAFTNLFSVIGITFKKHVIDQDVAIHIMDFINQQVYRATGDYYYSNVDQNREPIGVFIESMSINERYYTDEPIAISANILARTIGDKLTGELNCYLNDRRHDSMTPSDGKISVDRTMPIRVQCGYERNRFVDSGRMKFEIVTIFELATFAYMAPSIIRRSVWDNMTQTQQARISSTAGDSFLRTSNSPVQIGGELGRSSNNIIAINDISGSIGAREVPFGMTLHADKQSTTWDEGKIKSIKNLIISIPNTFQLREEDIFSEDRIKSCVGYVFRKSDDCSILKEYLGNEEDYRYLCMDGDRIYILDQSGNNPKLMDIRTFKTLQCTLEANIEEMFKGEESEELGFNQIGIKIYTDYVYEVSKTAYLNLVRRATTPQDILRTYNCIGTIESAAKNGTIPDNNTIEKYKKLQNTFRRNLPITLPESERARLEAMLASASYKFSDFEINTNTDSNNNGIIDYLTGCLGTTSLEVKDNHERQIKCLIGELNDNLIKYAYDVEKAFNAYYEKNNDTYSTDKQATIQDYQNWLKLLCDIKEEQSQEENNEESNTEINNEQQEIRPGTTGIGGDCSENKDCTSFNCDQALKKCFACNPEEDRCPENYICNETSNICELIT